MARAKSSPVPSSIPSSVNDPNQFERGETPGNLRNEHIPADARQQYEIFSGGGNRGQYRNSSARSPSAKNGRNPGSSSGRGHKAA